MRLLLRSGDIYRDSSSRLGWAGSAESVAVGDFDVDGDTDIAVIASGTLRLLRNSGTANFVLDPQSVAVPFGALTAADLNGDRAVELLLESTQGLSVIANDGRGNLTLTPAVAPSNPAGAVTLDADGDRDLDVVCHLPGGALALYSNDGTGALTHAPGAMPAPRAGRVNRLAVLDVDADGDLDLAVAAPRFASEILRNNSGTFTRPPVPFLPLWAEVGSLVAGDVDGDGRDDLIACVAGHLDPVICLSPSYQPLNAPDVPAGARAVADLDGDLAPDVIGFAGGPTPTRDDIVYVARNDGAGRCAVASTLTLPAAAHAVLTGDADGDGDTDVLLLVAQTLTTALHTLRNDGAGNLTLAATQTLFAGSYIPKAASDLDRDGDVDLVWVDGNNGVVLENQGAAGFVPRALPGFVGGGRSVATLDLEDDGRPDLLTCDGAGLHLYANRGGLSFVEVTNLVTNPLPGSSLAIATRDRTTNELLLLSYAAATNALRLHALHGGSFVVAANAVSPAAVGALRFVDFRPDRSPHAIVTSTTSRALTTALNDDTAATLGAYAVGDLPVLADLDGDQDLDVIHAGNAGVRLLRGARQVFAPYGAHPGHVFRIDHQLNGANALTLVGAVQTAIATPFGVLRVDPNTAITLAVSGQTRNIEFDVPASPALLGLPLLAQALTAVGPPALTNLEKRVVR